MKLFVAGHVIKETVDGIVWDVIGIFDSKEKAISACYDENCFVGPLILNATFSKEIITWPGAFYVTSEIMKRHSM